jgi:hypothetical protein
MGSVRQPRGRLPRRVYWFRRLLVLGLAAALVLGIGTLLGGLGSDDPPPAARARTTSAEPRDVPSSQVPIGPVAPDKKLLRQQKRTETVLVPPSGECREDEVSVVPEVARAAGGGPIVLRLELSGTQPACSFEVSPETLVVKITSGKDRIWTSQECPRAIPKTSVVVRSAVPATVPVTWSGRRSDETCSNRTAWALPGFYHVHAAALGSAPSDVQFEVTVPSRPVVTRTAKPKPSATATTGPRTATSPGATATTTEPEPRPTAKPSPTRQP